MSECRRLLTVALLALLLNGCVGTAVGTAADVTLEVAKLPFRVAGAAVDVASGDDDEDEEEEED